MPAVDYDSDTWIRALTFRRSDTQIEKPFKYHAYLARTFVFLFSSFVAFDGAGISVAANREMRLREDDERRVSNTEGKK